MANDCTESGAEQYRTGELEKAKEAAEAASRSKSRFLANMSHEIRTPLTAIIGYTDLVMKTGLTPVQRDYVGKIASAGESLLRIINDILDFSKIEAGKMDLEFARFKLDDVLARVMAIVRQKADKKGLTLRLDAVPELPGQPVGDPHRLGQVLTNLLGNAVKFTEQGEVTLSVALHERTPGTATLRFSVRDTGTGLSPEAMAKLFTPFTQADGSTTRRFGGTGLGLSISKQLVELMGGEIWCESEPGQGSTFSFTAQFGIGEQPDSPGGPGGRLSPLARDPALTGALPAGGGYGERQEPTGRRMQDTGKHVHTIHVPLEVTHEHTPPRHQLQDQSPAAGTDKLLCAGRPHRHHHPERIHPQPRNLRQFLPDVAFP